MPQLSPINWLLTFIFLLVYLNVLLVSLNYYFINVKKRKPIISKIFKYFVW